jgi:hypothetical protein
MDILVLRRSSPSDVGAWNTVASISSVLLRQLKQLPPNGLPANSVLSLFLDSHSGFLPFRGREILPPIMPFHVWYSIPPVDSLTLTLQFCRGFSCRVQTIKTSISTILSKVSQIPGGISGVRDIGQALSIDGLSSFCDLVEALSSAWQETEAGSFFAGGFGADLDNFCADKNLSFGLSFGCASCFTYSLPEQLSVHPILKFDGPPLSSIFAFVTTVASAIDALIDDLLKNVNH